MPFLFFQAEPYINMLLRSVQHMGHSNALKKVLPHFDSHFQPCFATFFSKELYWLIKIFLGGLPLSDRYSAQSLRWISVFHCRPEIEITRMTTND